MTIVQRQSVGHALILNPRATLRAVKLPPAPLVRRFQRRLLAWYATHGRDLPWRRTRHPYRVLVSEIMLQQTQVDRVIPKYRQFLRRYPTIHDLAKARVEDVRRLWYPRGYDFNQALMDFGATWCTPRKPKCPYCPMKGFCATVASLSVLGAPCRS